MNESLMNESFLDKENKIFINEKNEISIDKFLEYDDEPEEYQEEWDQEWEKKLLDAEEINSFFLVFLNEKQSYLNNVYFSENGEKRPTEESDRLYSFYKKNSCFFCNFEFLKEKCDCHKFNEKKEKIEKETKELWKKLKSFDENHLLTIIEDFFSIFNKKTKEIFERKYNKEILEKIKNLPKSENPYNIVSEIQKSIKEEDIISPEAINYIEYYIKYINNFVRNKKPLSKVLEEKPDNFLIKLEEIFGKEQFKKDDLKRDEEDNLERNKEEKKDDLERNEKDDLEKDEIKLNHFNKTNFERELTINVLEDLKKTNERKTNIIKYFEDKMKSFIYKNLKKETEEKYKKNYFLKRKTINLSYDNWEKIIRCFKEIDNNEDLIEQIILSFGKSNYDNFFFFHDIYTHMLKKIEMEDTISKLEKEIIEKEIIEKEIIEKKKELKELIEQEEKTDEIKNKMSKINIEIRIIKRICFFKNYRKNERENDSSSKYLFINEHLFHFFFIFNKQLNFYIKENEENKDFKKEINIIIKKIFKNLLFTTLKFLKKKKFINYFYDDFSSLLKKIEDKELSIEISEFFLKEFSQKETTEEKKTKKEKQEIKSLLQVNEYFQENLKYFFKAFFEKLIYFENREKELIEKNRTLEIMKPKNEQALETLKKIHEIMPEDLIKSIFVDIWKINFDCLKEQKKIETDQTKIERLKILKERFQRSKESLTDFISILENDVTFFKIYSLECNLDIRKYNDRTVLFFKNINNYSENFRDFIHKEGEKTIKKIEQFFDDLQKQIKEEIDEEKNKKNKDNHLIIEKRKINEEIDKENHLTIEKKRELENRLCYQFRKVRNKFEKRKIKEQMESLGIGKDQIDGVLTNINQETRTIEFLAQRIFVKQEEEKEQCKKLLKKTAIERNEIKKNIKIIIFFYTVVSLIVIIICICFLFLIFTFLGKKKQEKKERKKI